jgi:hypothetical protein
VIKLRVWLLSERIALFILCLSVFSSFKASSDTMIVMWKELAVALDGVSKTMKPLSQDRRPPIKIRSSIAHTAETSLVDFLEDEGVMVV